MSDCWCGSRFCKNGGDMYTMEFKNKDVYNAYREQLINKAINSTIKRIEYGMFIEWNRLYEDSDTVMYQLHGQGD